VISHVRQSAATWRAGSRLARIARKLPVGTTFRFTLSEAARVRMAFTQRVHGRRVIRGTLRFAGRAGTDSVRFQGRLSHRKRLKPGRYRLTIGATDAQGRTATPHTLSFTIARP